MKIVPIFFRSAVPKDFGSVNRGFLNFIFSSAQKKHLFIEMLLPFVVDLNLILHLYRGQDGHDAVDGVGAAARHLALFSRFFFFHCGDQIVSVFRT